MNSNFQMCPVTGLRWKITESSAGAAVLAPGRIGSIDISLNNVRCSGPYLAFQLLWAQKLFPTLEFALGDTLQRHNYRSLGQRDKGVLSPVVAENVARQEGDEWLTANSSIMSTYWSGPSRIRRWDEWRAHPEFQSVLERSRAILQSPTMRPLLRKDALNFALRRGHTEASVADSVLSGLEEFIIEEIGVYYLHSRSLPVVHLYAGQALSTLHYFDIGGDVPETLDSEFLQVMHQRMFVYFDVHQREKANARV